MERHCGRNKVFIGCEGLRCSSNDGKLKLPGLMTCSGASDDSSNTARVWSPLSVMAHESECGIIKSPDRVRICVSYNRVRNLPCV
jgi:hypothetical protein